MSIIAAIRAVITTQRFVTTFKVVEYTGTALSAAHLADEVARAIMKGRYDPALTDRIEEVTEAGEVYDKKLEKAVKIHSDITNLSGGIQALTSIVIDFGDRQELVRQKLDKLVELRRVLSDTTPLTYMWFQTLGLRRGDHKDDLKGDLQELERIREENGPNYFHMGIFAAELGLHLAIPLGMRAWAYWQGTGPRPQANSLARAEPGLTTRRARMTARLKPMLKVMATGIRTVLGSFSFIYGIFYLYEKVRRRDEAMTELQEMLSQYEEGNEVYEYVFSGSPDDGALQRVADHFDIDLNELNEDAQEDLKAGYKKMKESDNETLKDILGSIDVVYDEMLTEFRMVAAEEDQPVIARLELSHRRYKDAEKIALDSERSGEDRRVKGLDKIRDEFTNSVSEQLNQTLATLSEEIENHNSYSLLTISAERLRNKKLKIETDAARPGSAQREAGSPG